VMRRASSSRWASSSSRYLKRSAVRRASERRPQPPWYAARAEATARSTSASSARATWVGCSPVAGS
jgi:hypothetical protein